MRIQTVASRPDPRMVLAAALFLASMFFFTLRAAAGPQIWTGGAPRAKSIDAILADPVNPARMWAASFGAGVFVSLDGGSTWAPQRTGLVNTFVRALAVQPRHPDSVYCGTNDGVFLSVDGGATWSKLLSTNASVRSIVVHPVRTGVIYAATFGSGIYKSLNAGKNWSQVNLGLVNTTVRDIALDPAMPETLLAATGTGGGVERSVNGGLSWTQVADTTANRGAVGRIQFDPLEPNRVYAAMLDRGVIKSGDRGGTWVSINRGLTSFRTRSLAVVDTLRYVGTDGSGVFVSSLSDTSWHPASSGLTSLTVDALLARPQSPATCWAGTDGAGIFLTTDRAATWAQIDGGLLATYGFSLAVRPSTGVVYDGTGFGDQMWRSADGGQTWTRASYLFSHDSEHGLVPDPVLAQTVYLSAYGLGVYRSDDDGVTWSNPDSLSATLVNHFVRDLVAYPGKSGHVYVGTGDGVWETLDGGAHWAPLNSGLPAALSVRALALVPGTPPTLYAGSDSSGVWKSADGGASWAHATAGIPVPFIHTLAADATTPLTVFAGTDSGLYRTTDAGATWAPLRSGLPYGVNGGIRAIVQDLAHPSLWFAGAFGAGVFESRDHGVSWGPVSAQVGLGSLRVRSLAVDGARLALYAGTDAGIWALGQYATTAGVPAPEGVGALGLAAAPNPAVARTVVFSVLLPRAGPLDLALFEVSGARVRTLAHGAWAEAGTRSFTWDLRDDRGDRVAPGMYFARLGTAGGVRTLRLSVLGR